MVKTLSSQQIDFLKECFMLYAKEDIDVSDRLTDLFSIKKLSKGMPYLTSGEVWNTFSIIVKGLFRLYYIDEGGKEHTKGIFKERQILAPHATSAIGRPANFYIDSFEDTEILSADYWMIREYLDSTKWGQNIRISMLENVLDEKIKREYSWLMLDAESRYLQFVENSSDIANRLPLYIIANYLGMTDVTLSRIRKKLT